MAKKLFQSKILSNIRHGCQILIFMVKIILCETQTYAHLFVCYVGPVRVLRRPKEIFILSC